MKLARKVRHARVIRDLSQQELAERAGVSVSTIVRVEGAKGRLPREQTISALAKALEVDPAWLTDEAQDLADLYRRESPRAGPGSSAAGAPRPNASHRPEGFLTPAGNGRPSNGEIRDLLRQAIRAIERGGVRTRPERATAGPPAHAAGTAVEPWPPQAARTAPVFDIGADFDRDWHDGGFPTGQGHDQRPALNGDPSGFWCVLRGDSMEPELRDGDLLYFSPEWTRPTNGDICLIRTRDFATVKRFFKIGPTAARLAAANPRYPDRIVDLVEDVIQLHKVVCFVRTLD